MNEKMMQFMLTYEQFCYRFYFGSVCMPGVLADNICTVEPRYNEVGYNKILL